MEAAGAIEKAVDVLFHLHACELPQGVTAIGRALGLPKSSAHRLLRSLGRRGLVERDADGRYRPGIGLVALGLGALEREPVVAAARPVLEAEAEAVGETFFVVAVRAGRPVVLDKVEGTGFLRAAPRVGQEVPVHATAVGKLFLAFGGVELPRGRLERFTARTRVEAGALAREVAAARERGFADNREEWIPGLWVVAAAIHGASGVRGAIAVAAPTARMGALGRDEVTRRTVAAAKRVAARLEGSAT